MASRPTETRLPELRSLEAFAVAGQALSFSVAGGRLNVTTSAISRRIKKLELDLGFPLFERRGNRLRLTIAGRAYLPAVVRSFETLRGATAAARQSSAHRPVRLAVTPTFASNWLAPRLPKLLEANPTIDIVLDYMGISGPTDGRQTDLAVVINGEAHGNWVLEPLIEISVIPVCAPNQRDACSGLLKQDRDTGVVLLHCRHSPDLWDCWFHGAGGGTTGAFRHRYFDNLTLLHHAAMHGLGAGLAWLPLVKPHLDQGQLIAPIDVRVPVSKRFDLLAPPPGAIGDEVGMVRDWLLAAAA